MLEVGERIHRVDVDRWDGLTQAVCPLSRVRRLMSRRVLGLDFRSVFLLLWNMDVGVFPSGTWLGQRVQ